MAGLLSILGSLLGMSASAESKVPDIYSDMRKQVLTLTPDQLGLPKEQQVIAILMETGYPEAVATLVAIADGSTSLYFSNGGGIIGAGEHEGPQKSAKALVTLANSYLADLKLSKETPLPKTGRTTFFVVTRHGTLTGDFKEEDLGEGREKLSPLFHAAHDLIAQIRTVDEQRKARPNKSRDTDATN